LKEKVKNRRRCCKSSARPLESGLVKILRRPADNDGVRFSDTTWKKIEVMMMDNTQFSGDADQNPSD
jgi:hypothetical protein